jgi:hypothetical protein
VAFIPKAIKKALERSRKIIQCSKIIGLKGPFVGKKWFAI